LAQIRKPFPRWPAFDLPIAELDMLDDRVGDYVTFSVRERTQFLPNLPAEREAHVDLNGSQ